MSKGLTVSEFFFSIQGEGMTVGRPAVFIRLTGCPLGCSWCDTTEVWKKGKQLSNSAFLDKLVTLYSGFLHGSTARLVITGGSPTLQQTQLVGFFKLMENNYFRPYVEMETEGFIRPSQSLCHFVNQFNVSPKLGNSGVPYEKRINLDTLRYLSNAISCFKFVVDSEEDMKEVVDIVNEVAIPHPKVYLMPLSSTFLVHDHNAPKVVEWCLKTGFNFSPRLQLLIWDQATGV